MRKLITNDKMKCVACNRCISACPVEGANQVHLVDGQIKVSVDNERCIVCGACIIACRHEVRDYEDDTERFINDLKSGASISMFAAPANRVDENGGKVLAWLRSLGVKKIYDVSLGADICTWAHIRLIQKEHPKSVITQPCPAIVNYILRHEHGLIKYLSPVHSPMLCTAVYMKKYERVSENIAALSPCIAKSNEFEATGYVKYNVTLKKLFKYIRENNIELPNETSGFDHAESAFGRLYSMPGGLKENVEFYFGKKLRVDQSEGPEVVYDALRAFANERSEYLPAVFDVLNCAEGCNLGTGVEHNSSRFKAHAIMDKGRQAVLKEYDLEHYEKLLQSYDKKLNLGDFMRKYTPALIKKYDVSDAEIEKGYIALGKNTETQRTFDCGACGCDSCHDMAKRIAMGNNIPANCIQKLNDEIKGVLDIAMSNITSANLLVADITDIKNKSNQINGLIATLNSVILKYQKISTDINSISSVINIVSLNAMVEAARAGDQGKTFAVVAEEIRNLADNSKNIVSASEEMSKESLGAVNSINDLIGSIVKSYDNAHISISIINQSLTNILKSIGSENLTGSGT